MENPYELGKTVPRAAAIDTLKAPSVNGDNFKSTAVLTIEELPGLYREVSRAGRKGLTEPPQESGHVLALLVAIDKPPRPAEFVRWTALENTLAKFAGLEYTDEAPPF